MADMSKLLRVREGYGVGLPADESSPMRAAEASFHADGIFSKKPSTDSSARSPLPMRVVYQKATGAGRGIIRYNVAVSLLRCDSPVPKTL